MLKLNLWSYPFVSRAVAWDAERADPGHMAAAMCSSLAAKQGRLEGWMLNLAASDWLTVY